MISAQEIGERERSRNNIRKETYKNILEQFSKKVKAAVERREKYAVLQVPPLVMGFPLFPYDEALWYIRRQLVLLGYKVRQGGEEGQFIVTWEKPKKNKQIISYSEPGEDLFSGLANMQKTAAKLRGK
jgi:hypothetical protein